MAMKSGVSGALRREIFRRDNYACQGCGLVGAEKRNPRGSFTYPTSLDRVYLSIDHIVARSRGGLHEPSNLRVLCTTCNSIKGAGNA